MANYKMYYFTAHGNDQDLNDLQAIVRDWEGNIEISRDYSLKFSYPQKYTHDLKTIHELSSQFKEVEFHIKVTMNEGPDTLYIAKGGYISSYDSDQEIKDALLTVITEIHHRELYFKDVFEEMIEALEDDRFPWFDATLRYLMYPGLKEQMEKKVMEE